jgi:hypothetical protein
VPDIPTFNEYRATLGRLTTIADPTAASPEAAEIKSAAASLTALSEVSMATLTSWAAAHPRWVNL